MPPLRKPALLGLFENALRRSGVNFLKLSGETDHPASYQIIGDISSYRIILYIWNLSFGGRISLPDEWRIQVTGLQEVDGRQRFIQDPGGKTVILGWCSEFEVFAGYDVLKHLGPLGGSPSIQIRQSALERARANGIAPHFKGGDEVAFAVKPGYMQVYLDNIEELHACGSSEEALRILDAICGDPDSVAEDQIDYQVPEARRFAVVSARKAIRDTNFKDRVLTAYSNTCAMCGIQLRLLDAAHILPAAHPDSTDETRNGIALCALHHRAYDRGFITFDCRYRIHINEEMEEVFANEALDGGIQGFRRQLFPMIDLPPARADRPAPEFIEEVNTLRGWHL